jgi:hypothetical protein
MHPGEARALLLPEMIPASQIRDDNALITRCPEQESISYTLAAVAFRPVQRQRTYVEAVCRQGGLRCCKQQKQSTYDDAPFAFP